MLMLSLDDVCMMMIMVMMVMLMTLLEPLMIDDFDGALEMPDGDCIWRWSLDDPDGVLDDVGGAHDDVALGDGFGAMFVA